MNVASLPRKPESSLAGISLATVAAFAATGLLIYLAAEASVKVLAAVLSGAICLIGAYFTGNPRLYWLWCLMLTIPLDLSKRFGTVFLKMGGESSYRIEISDVFLLALAVYLARDIWTDRIPGLHIPKVTFVWILIMLLGCCWAAFGTWRLTAAQEVVRMFKLMILFLVITNELRSPRRVLHCAAGLSLGLVAEAIVGLIQYFNRAHLGLDLLGETLKTQTAILAASSVEGEHVFRASAFLSHPNLFGIFLAVLLPVVIGAFLLRLGKGYKLFFLCSAVLGMAALIVTLSRSGWMSFAAAFALLMLLMILHPGLRRRSLLAGALATPALVTLSGFFAEQILQRIFSSRDAAMLGRAEYIRDAWGMIEVKPVLGWGLNSYVFAVPPFTQYGAKGAAKHYRNWIPPVHNIYLLWWAETGVIGLALHLAFFASIVWTGIGNLRVKDEVLFTVNAACLSGMLAFFVDGFFSFSLRFNSLLRVYWVLAGIMLAVHYWRLRQHVSAPALNPAGQLLSVSERGQDRLGIFPMHPHPGRP